jgi:hypothetical protein
MTRCPGFQATLADVLDGSAPWSDRHTPVGSRDQAVP